MADDRNKCPPCRGTGQVVSTQGGEAKPRHVPVVRRHGPPRRRTLTPGGPMGCPPHLDD